VFFYVAQWLNLVDAFKKWFWYPGNILYKYGCPSLVPSTTSDLHFTDKMTKIKKSKSILVVFGHRSE